MYDVIIIGSGAAGLSAAIYAQRAYLKTIIIEKIFGGAGQITEAEKVDNYPGLYNENGYELGMRFRKHAEELGAEIYNDTANSINYSDGIYTVGLDNSEKSFQSKTIIYAAGTTHRRLDIEGEKEFEGRGVSYCALCDGAFYKNKIAAVIGGGDSALSEALYLSKIAEKVYIIHRRDSFRAGKNLQKKISKINNIEILFNHVPVKITGNTKAEYLIIGKGTEERKIKADGIFIAAGNVPNTSLVKSIAKLDQNGYIIADENGITSAPGFFAAGDVRTKKLRQLVTAASDGANALNSAEAYIGNLY